MTDEKMAEEKYCKGCKWRIEQCLWAWRNTNGLKEPNEKNCSCKEVPAFFTGLKAGRPQWHKVTDGDLPKENKLYFVAIKDNGCAIAYFNGLHWETKYNLGDFGHCVETVIAWCEIPTFDKE
jgi:hypothetical protein